MMNKYRNQHGNLLGYVDICMNLLVCFIALFFLASLLIKVKENESAPKTSLETTGKIIIHLGWDSKSSSDVDIWVTTANPVATVSFRNRDQANMILDNDNLGRESHQVEMADGTLKNTFGNNENVLIKECTNTKVTVNLHLYTVKGALPVNARVDLIKPQPYSVVHSVDLPLTAYGQEITAFSFDLDEDCNITNIDQVFRPFIYNKLTQSPTFPNSMGGN